MPISPRQLRAQAENAANPFPADCAARFRCEHVIASGGFGAVWLATQIELDRKVAVKLLHVEALEDREQRERFENEARITASLTSPHIVRIIDHGASEGIPWIAYEYLPGRSLRGRLDDGEVPAKDALTIAAQIADALQEAHERKILHRDVKPENVLEASAGHYKVTDFGIAKWTQGNQVRTKTGFVLGTPAYLAPEVIRGDEPSPRSDVYALGILLWEMLVGRLPFTDQNPVLLMERHLQLKPKPVSEAKAGLPAILDAVVQRAIEKDPQDRYQSAAELAQALHAAVQRLQAPEAAAPEPAARRPASRPTGATGRVRLTGTAPAAAPSPAGGGEGRALRAVALMAAMAVGMAVGWLAKPAPAPAPVLVATPAPVAPPSPAAAATLQENEARVDRELQALVAYVNAAPRPLRETPKIATLLFLHRKYELTVMEATVHADAVLAGWHDWTDNQLLLHGQSLFNKQRAYFQHLLTQARANPEEDKRLRRIRHAVDTAIADGLPILRAMARLPMGIGTMASAIVVMGSLFHQSQVMGSDDDARIEKMMEPFRGEPEDHWPVAYLRAVHAAALQGSGRMPVRGKYLHLALRGMMSAIEAGDHIKDGHTRQGLVNLARELADVAWRDGAVPDKGRVAADVEKALAMVRNGGGPFASEGQFRSAEELLKKLR